MPDNTQPQVSTKSKILVIDDSRLVRVSIKKVIVDEFEVIEAADGEEGWTLLQNNNDIRVVVTDNGMPKLDGFGLISRIRAAASAYLKSIPIIMVTGAEAGETQVREKALQIGATDFITKPFDKAQLLARIRAHAKHDKTQRSLIETEVALAERSTIDPVTKINNKKYFVHRGEQELAFSKRHHQELSFVSVAIDKYDNLVQQYGQATVNQLLLWVATSIKNTLRTEDTVTRIDTNLFAIIAPTAGRMAAAVLCERIRKLPLAKVFSHSQGNLSFTLSLGLTCLYKDEAQSIQDFITLLENRVIQAQQAGGNQTSAQTNIVEAKLPESLPDISLDKVLAAIQNGNCTEYQENLTMVAAKLYPLLAHCNEVLEWHYHEELATLKTKIG